MISSSSLPGRIHTAGGCSPTRSRQGCRRPARERSRGQDAAAGAAHRRPQGRHESGRTPASERTQPRRAIKGKAFFNFLKKIFLCKASEKHKSKKFQSVMCSQDQKCWD